eukprot:6691808-Pyramimonas_sp.AAC.1
MSSHASRTFGALSSLVVPLFRRRCSRWSSFRSLCTSLSAYQVTVVSTPSNAARPALTPLHSFSAELMF